MSSQHNSPGSASTQQRGLDWRAVFAFPNPVNEYAARITAGLVVLLAAATFLAGSGLGLAVIAAGFWLRVLFGPRISPLALLVAAASLEAFAGFCLGCTIFGFLQRRGMIPEDVCEACNNISLRQL
jgi:hypothetical protein